MSKLLESNGVIRRVATWLVVISSVAVMNASRGADAQEVTQEELPSPEAVVPADPAVVEGTEPLLRGPVHEAFAEPLTLDAAEPLTIEKEPPAAIEEVPPAEKPDGDDVAWIPGYWSWDEERKDYLWISGVWRKIPQGRAWVSGKWEKGGTGYQWIPGRWMPTVDLADGRVEADDAWPAPPATLEIGPNQDAPSEQHFWIPGCWQYREQRYVWRPGFWSPCQENWVWVPDHYVPVIGGVVYVPGYWDYGWERRGVLYAPCVIDRTVAYRPGFRYTPTVVVSVTDSFFHLWVRPTYRHYYFGDYYDARYSNWGFVPWYAYHRSSAWAYDPLFVHYRWRFGRDNIDLRYQLHHQHDYYRSHIQDRPVHSYRYGDRDFASRPGGPHTGHERHQDRVLGYNPRAGAHAAGFATREDLRNAVLARQNDPSYRNRPGDDYRRPGGSNSDWARDRLSSGQSPDAWRRGDWDGDLPRARQGSERRGGGPSARQRDQADGSPSSPIVNPRGVPNQQFGVDRNRDARDFGRGNVERDSSRLGAGADGVTNARPNLTLDELRQRTGREGRMRSTLDSNANRPGSEPSRGRDRVGSVGAERSGPNTGTASSISPVESAPRGRIERFESFRNSRPEGATPGANLSTRGRGNDFPDQLTTPRGRLNGDPGRVRTRDSAPQTVAPRSVPQADARPEGMRSRGDMGRIRNESFRPQMESRGSFERNRGDFGRPTGDGGRGNIARGAVEGPRPSRGAVDGGRGNLPMPPGRPGGGRGRGGND